MHHSDALGLAEFLGTVASAIGAVVINNDYLGLNPSTRTCLEYPGSEFFEVVLLVVGGDDY